MQKEIPLQEGSSIMRQKFDYGKRSSLTRKSFIMRREFDHAKANSIMNYEKEVRL